MLAYTHARHVLTDVRCCRCCCCGLCDVATQAYEGLRTADKLDEQYVFIPQKVKDVYLHHLLLHCLASLQEQLQQQQQPGAAAAAAEQGSGSDGFKRVRSAIIFVSTCKGCHMLSLVLRELGLPAAALHSGEHVAQGVASLSVKDCSRAVACGAVAASCRDQRMVLLCCRVRTDTLNTQYFPDLAVQASRKSSGWLRSPASRVSTCRCCWRRMWRHAAWTSPAWTWS
jgi:hypothetical protein